VLRRVLSPHDKWRCVAPKPSIHTKTLKFIEKQLLIYSVVYIEVKTRVRDDNVRWAQKPGSARNCQTKRAVSFVAEARAYCVELVIATLCCGHIAHYLRIGKHEASRSVGEAILHPIQPCISGVREHVLATSRLPQRACQIGRHAKGG
jgi:hypothetical protein